MNPIPLKRGLYASLVCRASLLCLLALAGLGGAVRAHAANDAAYAADVPVNSQADEDRSAGLKAALGLVLGRLVGDPGIATRPDVAKALAQAPNYIQQYQYVRSTDAAAGSATRWLLHAQFDAVAVDDLLRRLHLSNRDAGNATAVAESGGTLRVQIEGIHSASDYSRALGALAGSDSVLALTPERAHGSTLLVTLKLRSSTQHLLETLAAAQVLAPQDGLAAPDGADLLLLFHP